MYKENNVNVIFKKSLSAQARHAKFLQATENNLSLFYFGKNVNLIKNVTMSLFPEINMIDALTAYDPEPYNPLQYLLNAFMNEIVTSRWDISINQVPRRGDDSERICDFWEDIIKDVHFTSQRKRYFKPLLFEVLLHGYSCMYFDGWNNVWYPLTSYDVIPGDPSIPTWQDQPFIVRITSSTIGKLKCNCDDVTIFDGLNDDEEIKLYDVWDKNSDLNVLYTEDGKVVYSQEFPNPKDYPFFGPIDSDMLKSFYSVPVVLMLSELLYKFQDSTKAIENSSSQIARPMLVFDNDSGINIDDVIEAIENKYDTVVVGKNAGADISYKQPGSMPMYAIDQPDKIMAQMMRVLGINPAFLGNPMAGVRERGALSNLIKASFRELSAKVTLLEQAFTDLDNYILKFYNAHRTVFGNTYNMKLEDILFPVSKLVANDYLVEFSTKDTQEDKTLAISNYRNGIISHEQALRELGYNQPQKIIKQQQDEAKQNEIAKLDIQEEIRERLNKGLIQRISEALKGRLQFRYWLTPIANNKVLVKIDIRDRLDVLRLLSKYADNIELEIAPVRIKKNGDFVNNKPTPYQKDLEVPEQAPLAEQLSAEQQPEQSQQPEKKEVVKTETDKVAEEQSANTSSQDKITMLRELIAKRKGSSTEQTKEEPEVEINNEPQKVSNIEAAMVMGDMVTPTPEMLDYEALYFSEPAAKNMWNGSQKAFIKTRYMPELVGKKMLLAGDKVYGMITVNEITKDFDFEQMREYHGVSDEDKQKWWGDKPLFLYAFEINPFDKPLNYNIPNGANNIIRKVSGVKL